MTLDSLLNQFKSGGRTYPDKLLRLSRTPESLSGFGHVQNFYQIGRICSEAVKFSSCLALLVALALQCSKIILVFFAGLFVSFCSIFDQIKS